MTFINQGQKCSSSELETSCFCEEEQCNKVDLEENIPKPLFVPVAATNNLCYVGFYANNTDSTLGTGDTVTCSPESVCTSISGVYDGYDTAIYACMPQSICDNIFPNRQCNQACADFPGTNFEICCCYLRDCTGLAPMPNPPTPSPWSKSNQTCYQGLAINGVTYAGGTFSQCFGECGSFRIRTVYNEQTVWAEVFVCDPVNVFTGLNLDNECKNIDTTNIDKIPTALITGCACNTDKCIDPTVVPPVYPIKQLRCAVGLYNGTTWLGAEMNCQGRCGRLKFNANGQQVSYFNCMPYDVCAGFGLASSEGQTYNPPQDDELEIYCCSAFNNCNVNNPNVLGRINNSDVSTVKYPVLCYEGIWVNGVPITNSAYGLCQGECASASFTTTFANQVHNAIIYTCDPVTMCQQAGISNSCGNVLGEINACCCDNDLCIDPNRGFQQPSLRCYSGISIPQDNYNSGGDQFCDGWCGSLNSVVNGKNATVYYCAPIGMCRYFGLGFGGSYGNCGQIPGADPSVTGCCCSDFDNCLAPDGVDVTAIPARRDPRIVCYEGIYLNGQNVTQPYYSMCDGECAFISFGGTVNNMTHYATLYTCDPSSSCAAMGLRNNCSTIDNSLTACCCDSNECIDPTYNRVPGISLKCYVGINTKYGGLNIGAEVLCDGYCASISAVVGSDNITAFHCAPRSMCRSLGLDNSNNSIFLDRAINVGCCDVSDNCNLIGSGVSVTNVPPVAPNESPRACYSGIFVGKNQVSDGGWTSCNGDCVSVTLNTTYNRVVTTASLYTCDPSYLCRALNATNSCHTLEEGLETCCCDSNACIDPTVFPARTPGNQLMCFVGLKSKYGINIGAQVTCNGQCASLSGIVNGYQVNSYHCVPNYICNSLELYDSCKSIYNDNQVQACCCNNANNCNIANTTITPPPPPTAVDFAIACYTGLSVNGIPATPITLGACQGQCTSISLNTTLQGIVTTATLYGCDPNSVCQQLNISNACQTIEPGVSACCCDSDECLNPSTNTLPGPLNCYVGIYTSDGKVNTGATVPCDGFCGSLETTVAGILYKSYHCVPKPICMSLELNNQRKTISTDKDITGYCCTTGSNCHVKEAIVHVPNVVTPQSTDPIACRSSIYLNSAPITDESFTLCYGQCASVSYSARYNSAGNVLTFYTCDPNSVCDSLNLLDSCATIDGGLSGCCCKTNNCIGPNGMGTPPTTMSIGSTVVPPVPTIQSKVSATTSSASVFSSTCSILACFIAIVCITLI